MKVIIYLFCSSIVWCYGTSFFYFSNFYNITTSLKDKTYKYKDYDTFSSLDFNSLTKNNDPRIKGKTVKSDKHKTIIEKGVFTTCKRNDDCPPWEFLASKITHDKKKKTINYENSWLKIFGKSSWDIWQLKSVLGSVSDDLYHSYSPMTKGVDVILSGFFSSIGVHGLLRSKITNRHLEEAKKVMTLLGLLALANKSLSKMSVGQQRRFLLARALVHNPKTLILDEPTTSLDLPSTFKYLKLLKKLKCRGHNFILVTHNLHEINDDIDRVILLNKGKIIADGAKSKVITEKNLYLTYEIEIGLSIHQGHYLPFHKG